jgi:LysR family transcriptional regulator, low CO2-responsive transcriptional regulator
MTFSQMRAFEAVARHLNMTRAAESLNISEPSVFKQLKLLEQYCGVRLYRKVGRHIELTREGRLVQADIREILLKADRLRDRFRHEQITDGAEPLIVAASHGPSVFLVPFLLAAFKELHPLAPIVFRTRDSQTVERLVLDGDVEIGLVTRPSHAPELRTIPYRQEKVVIFVSTRHPLASKDEFTMAEFANGPLVVRKGRGAKTWDILEQVEAQGLPLNILMECESAEALKAAVSRGMGLGILYQDHLEAELGRGELKLIKVAGLRKIESKSYIVQHKDKPLSHNAQEFFIQMQRARIKPRLRAIAKVSVPTEPLTGVLLA